MRILADENITQVKAYFSSYGDVQTVSGRDITPALVKNVDALLVRSVTQVTPKLLAGSQCRFVATATSGLDHIDAEGLAAAGIQLAWAKGCNSIAVVDYFIAVLAALPPRDEKPWLDESVGIIGCGLIGSALAERLLKLGMRIKIYDPLLSPQHPLAEYFSSLQEVLHQSIITLHVPLTTQGQWPTKHMLSAKELAEIPHNSVLINAARGAAINNADLLQWLQERPNQQVVLDTWESEPAISLPLLERVTLGTPHIAGYSQQGKLMGTIMIFQQFCRYFGHAVPTVVELMKSEQHVLSMPKTTQSYEQLNSLLRNAYDIRKDHTAMLQLLSSPTPVQDFDLLRKHYPERHELTHFSIESAQLQPSVLKAATGLGFSLLA